MSAQPVLNVEYRWDRLCAILVKMQGVDVFCERCGTPQPKPELATPRSAGFLARRVLDAVGITENQPTPTEDWLRLCFSCRGYSCPTCWNETAGVCQTCEPLPAPIVELAPEPMPEPVVIETVPEPEPQPVLLAEVEPEPEMVVVAEPEPERESVDIVDADPVFVAELEPEPDAVLVAETEPEMVVVAEPEPEPEPDAVERPRMPILPLPPPRPADAPAMPLPPLPDHPIAPHIAFTPHVSVAASSQTSAPAYEAHLLLAPPPQLPQNAIAAGLRPCANCHLTLSARAHFCRRCGTAQAH